MENTRKPWARAMYLPVLAVGVALVAAVSSWASGPATATTPSQSPAPAAQLDTAPVQNTETTPAAPADRGGPGGGPGGREDCPEKDGAGAGSGDDSSGAAAPDATSSESQTEV